MKRAAWTAMAVSALATALVFTMSPGPRAQGYPDRPIKVLVPLAAASAIDIVARIVGEKMGAILGQSFYVEDQPGAAGMIAMRAAARAAPDGYTLVAVNDSVITMVPNMKSDAGYDPLKDFAPIAQLIGIPLGLIANPEFPAKDVAELLALARAKPGSINYASGGVGSPQHIAMELLARTAGVQMTHVPYRGVTAAVNEVVGGHVPIGFTALSAVGPLLADKRVRLLATSASTRVPQFPDTPTIAESGIPGFGFVAWGALLAPAGTPPDIIARLNAAALAALRDPIVRNKLINVGFSIAESTPEQLAENMRRDYARMGELIRAAHIGE
ncbi:MAG TPA: tripartite tricarboxylate transporter substrate binding protein [Xanthobacteraceae bacterium]|nr:tripartite tricarboxylate transporter substrate binding protein [Xanthobacteraceae bacterium]